MSRGARGNDHWSRASVHSQRRRLGVRPGANTDGPDVNDVLSQPSDAPGTQTLIAGLCQLALVSCRPIGLCSVSVSRVVDGHLSGVVYASDAFARTIDELQALIGTGPGPSAIAAASPVLAGRLVEASPVRGDWSTFLAETATLGVGSIWVLPLQIGAVSLGTLTLSGTGPTLPNGEVLSTAFNVADALTTVLRAVGGYPRSSASSLAGCRLRRR